MRTVIFFLKITSSPSRTVSDIIWLVNTYSKLNWHSNYRCLIRSYWKIIQEAEASLRTTQHVSKQKFVCRCYGGCWSPRSPWSNNVVQLSTKFSCQCAKEMNLSSGYLLAFLFFCLIRVFLPAIWGFLLHLNQPHIQPETAIFQWKGNLANTGACKLPLLLSGLSFYNSFTLFRVIRPQEMQLGPWPWEVGGFNASLQLQRGVSDAREAFSQQGHLVSRCHWRLKIRLPFHDPWWK